MRNNSSCNSTTNHTVRKGRTTESKRRPGSQEKIFNSSRLNASKSKQIDEAEAEALAMMAVSTTATEAEAGKTIIVAIVEVQVIIKIKGLIWITRLQKPMQMFPHR